MINITCREETYRYSAYHMAKAFYPDEEVSTVLDESAEILILVQQGGQPIAAVGAAGSKLVAERELYRQLSLQSGRTLPWGILLGVRPTKLALASDLPRDAFISHMAAERLVSGEKAGLAWDISRRERRIITSAIGSLRNPETYSIYIGIPVCPSICSYCSFSSGPLSVWKNRMDDYVEALCRELDAIFAAAARGNWNLAWPDQNFPVENPEPKELTSIYIGGGTPTVLTETQLEKLLKKISRLFDLSKIKEFTLEAGRPDTINETKLKIAKDYGITRLSINPQTMQQKTLERIGRKHTTKEVYVSFELARSLGFDNINMDIIAGLPGEGAEEMADSLGKIEELRPDSLTVHSLAIKRAATLTSLEVQSGEIEKMINFASESAARMGLNPYYLYRQKSISGNFENIGYATPGREGIYNIMIMEEVQNIIGAGAGASSKILLSTPVANPERAGKDTLMLHHTNNKDINGYIKQLL